jgi:hypothetical protein
MALTFQFDRVNRFIIIPSPTIAVTVQQIYDEAREFESDIFNLDLSSLVVGSGKQDLGGGVQVGVTVELINDWRIKFEDRPGPTVVQVSITGGNLVTVNSFDNNPIASSTFVQVQITSSSSATISSLEIINLQRLIESQRSHHSGFGNIWYWDPVNGSDVLDGTSPSTAVKTFAQAHNLVTANNHDIIVAHPGADGAVTVADETIVISKAYTFLRGPGRDFKIEPTSTLADTITITAEGVEVSSLLINTAPTGGRTGIRVLGGDFALLKDVWVEDSSGHAIHISNSSGSVFNSCRTLRAGGNGILIGDNTQNLEMNEITSSKCVGDAARLEGTGILEVIFKLGNYMYCSGWGINIVEANDTVIGVNVSVHNNALGDIFDSGIGTRNDLLVIINNASDAVWDKDLTAFPIGAGRVVLDASKILRNKTITDPATGIMTVYDDDGVTVLFTANLYEDAGATIPYSPASTRIDRRNRLT